MATSNMHNLTTLIKRLEAATSRLEDMASTGGVEAPKSNGLIPSTIPAPLIGATPTPSAQKPSQPAAEPLPESIEVFDQFIALSVRKYVSMSEGIGGPVAEQAAKVLQAFEGQRKFLLITTKAKKPDMTGPAYVELLKPLQEQMQAVGDIRERNRASPLFNQLSAVSESIAVLAWVTTDQQPYKHVEELLGSAQYYGNRVIKENKEKDPKQVEWVQSYYQIFKALAEYVKEKFPHGILWNAKGVSTQEASKMVSAGPGGSSSAPSPPTASAGGPPPPPPPPPGPPPVFQIDEKSAVPASGGSGLGAVFSELNKGEAVTKGLRKVNPNEMTHKNPSLRAGATVPTRSDSQSSVSSVTRGKSPAPGKKPKPESMRTKKPPRKELDGNKWIIENYDNEPRPVRVEVEMSQSILISRCSKTTIIVNGKANAVSVDNSPRLSLVVESLVSSVDVIKSSNFALQVMGTLPTILMDQVDGAQVYLGKDSMHTEVFVSKCSGINLNIMDTSGDDEDYKEVALPEQIRSYIDKDGKIKSEIVEHAG